MAPITNLLNLPINLSFPFLIFSSIIFCITYAVHVLILRPTFFTTLKNLPGPKRTSILMGNMDQVGLRDVNIFLQLVKQYGSAVKVGSEFGSTNLLLTDPGALAYIMIQRPYDFPRPDAVSLELKSLFGDGLISSEGDQHRRQRKCNLPAFSSSTLRIICPSFFAVSYTLRKRFHALLAADSPDLTCFKNQEAAEKYQSTKPAGETVVDVYHWGLKFAIDVVGDAGFGLQIGNIDDAEDVISQSFLRLATNLAPLVTTWTAQVIQRAIMTLQFKFPILNGIISHEGLELCKAAFDVMTAESTKIIALRKQEVLEAGIDSIEDGKDIISLLLKSNMKADSKGKLTDQELIAQLPTFLAVGSETTAASVGWTFHSLAANPIVQDKLRLEIRTARKVAMEEGRLELSCDELSALPYLNAVVQESLRLDAPVPASYRKSAKHDLIPLSTPIFSPSTNTFLSHVTVAPGQEIIIPVSALNRSTIIFGDDANEFRPERWLEGSLSEKSGSIGVAGHLWSFSAGPRSCIAYRFVILELKAMLSVMIDEFVFSERESGLEVEGHSPISVWVPYIKEELELGARMPLRMSVAAK